MKNLRIAILFVLFISYNNLFAQNLDTKKYERTIYWVHGIMGDETTWSTAGRLVF